MQNFSSALANKILPNQPQAQLLPPLALPLQVELVEEQLQVSSSVPSSSSPWPEWHSTCVVETGLLLLYSATRNLLRALEIFHRFLTHHLQHTLLSHRNSHPNQAIHQLQYQSLAHMTAGQHKTADSRCGLRVLKWLRLAE